jgi:disulfide bond formation protein DsbB
MPYASEGMIPAVVAQASEVGSVSLFLALLTLIAQAAVIAAVVLWVAARWSASAARLEARIRAAVGPSALWLAWGVALVSTLGSLYFSEVAGFVPCELCWYQRICMYPLVVLIAVAAWRRRVEIARATLPLIGIGAVISTYHYLLQRFPSWESAGSCDPSAPCTLVWIWRFHYLSIPAMALSAFALIAVLVATATETETEME